MADRPDLSLQPIPLLAALGVAIAGPFIWVGLYTGMNNGWIAPPLIGLLVGAAMRMTMKHGDRRLQVAALILTVLACIVGYVWTDLAYVPWIVKPDLFGALKHMLNDFTAVLLMALGAYIAWVMAMLPKPSAGASNEQA